MALSISRMETILIIDDKTANIFAIEKLLEKDGRSFLSAMDGKEGLRLALHEAIDLIILDVQMPEMDGFEVAKILKSHKKTAEIPIIFASAEKKERQSVMKGFEEGAFDYLSKPLDPDLTRAKVSVLLKIQAQKKELMEKNAALEKAEARIKELNSDLHANVLQLETVNRELESFSYSVSHDLRAPLRSVIGYAKILAEDFMDRLDAEGRKALNIIVNNSARMNKLIDDLLEFSKLGRKEIKKAEVDFTRLVTDVLRDLNSTITHKADVKASPLHAARADYALINQVWVNLLSNAIKYSSKKETPVVEIGSQKAENEIIYYVRDNGAGFNMEYADKLFGVFQRLHHATEFEGTGVGLALVQRIINKHGGRVWAEGAVDKGATFYFSLPQN